MRIGISGWRYEPWRGVFYPDGLTQRRELEYASRRMNSIEINGSFYSLQRPEYYREWAADTPTDFRFAVKGPRYITHMRRLRDVAAPLANFFASGVLALGEKLGPFLWQFPPNFRYDPERFEAFFALLPRDVSAAQSLARRHESRMSGRVAYGPQRTAALRHAVEIRHESFVDPAFVAQLRRHGIALVVADAARRYPLREQPTADFMYLRLHGEEELYASGYTEAALDRWAARIDEWAHGREPHDAARVDATPAPAALRRDVYCYFDNDRKVHAPFDAQSLMRRLGVEPAGGADDALVRGEGAPRGRATDARRRLTGQRPSGTRVAR